MYQGGKGSCSPSPAPQPLPPEVLPNITSNCREETEWGEPLPIVSLQSGAEHDLNLVPHGMEKVRDL